MNSKPSQDTEAPVDSSRRQFMTQSGLGLTGLALAGLNTTQAAEQPSTSPKLKRPACLFFDVNETLLDLQAMKHNVAEALGGRGDLLPLWFTTMLQYSLVSTVGDKYDDFGAIGLAALHMVAASNGIKLDEASARAALGTIRRLPPHADVLPALERLKAAGFRMVSFTNSSHQAVDAQLAYAGLEHIFEERLSIEDIQMFKPHGHAYKWAARRMNTPLPDCMLIAAHGWDIAGAGWAGWRTAFIARPGAQAYPLAEPAELTAPHLGQIADQLIALPTA